MLPNSQEATELVKFFGVVAAALAAILGGFRTWADVQKSKTSFDPTISQTLASNMEKDGQSRRESTDLMARVLVRLSETSIQMNDNHQAGQRKTEELHAFTRKEIASLGDKVEGNLKTIQSNQENMIQLIGPISEKFRSAA